jgi:hypothetical protein
MLENTHRKDLATNRDSKLADGGELHHMANISRVMRESYVDGDYKENQRR